MKRTKTIRVSWEFNDYMKSFKKEWQKGRGEKITMPRISDLLLFDLKQKKRKER